jgi:hypothetical protein
LSVPSLSIIDAKCATTTVDADEPVHPLASAEVDAAAPAPAPIPSDNDGDADADADARTGDTTGAAHAPPPDDGHRASATEAGTPALV